MEDNRYLESQTSKTKIKANKRTGIIDSGDNKITATSMRFKIDDINPENFYMNARLTESRKGNLYGELLYLHEGQWVRPIIILPAMNGCRFDTNHFGITTLTGNLSLENSKQKRAVEKIVKIHKRVKTIVENHPTLEWIEGGFPITRFLGRREDELTGEKIYTITAEVEPKQKYRHYTFEGTVFLNKDGKPITGRSLSVLKRKEVDVLMSIDISFIKLSENQDAINNKIKIVAIKIKEAREIVQDYGLDDDSDDDDSEVYLDLEFND